jgi:hypothetical protein
MRLNASISLTKAAVALRQPKARYGMTLRVFIASAIEASIILLYDTE